MKKVIKGNRIGWMDSANMPSHIHRTENRETTICGHSPFTKTNWKVTCIIPRKRCGKSNYCRKCFENGGKTLPWII